MEGFVDGEACLLMNRHWLALLEYILVDVLAQDLVIVEVAARGFPHSIDNLLVVLLLEHAIAPKYDEVVVVANFEAFDVWRGHDAHWVAAVARIFCLYITNGS